MWDDRINRLRCDTCGKFIILEAAKSFVFVPESDVTYEENLIQCVSCTNRLGPIIPKQSVNLNVCCGSYE